MSRLYVPPGLSAKKYLNLATINGIDIGSGTPNYDIGAAVRDTTAKNDLWPVRAATNLVPTPEDGFAIEWTSVGTKLSFQLSDACVMFFQVLTILNPQNSIFTWTTAGEYLDVYLYNAGSVVDIKRHYYAMQNNVACGPFLSEMYLSLPVGQSDVYILSAWGNAAGNQVNLRHIAARVNIMGYAL